VVIATHIIFTAYGFWLPNAPRGSWSDFVASWELLRAGGKSTPVKSTESSAHVEHDQQLRAATKEKLHFPAVTFNGQQALAIIRGFDKAVKESKYQIYALSIMPDHVHLVAERHDHESRVIARHLKARATQQLLADGLHPLSEYRMKDGSVPTPWVRNCWRVFLETRDEVRSAIEYVDHNPVKDGHKRQRWSFVKSPLG
jgi:REP element-mobilizing transposase RayT